MAQVNTIDYRFSNYAHRHIMFETLTKLYCASPTVDILWQLLLRFHQQVPNWQGMMHTVHSGSKQPGSPRQSTESYLLQLSNCVYLKTLYLPRLCVTLHVNLSACQVESCENPINISPDMNSDLDDTDNCDIYLQYRYRIFPLH